MAAVSLPLAPGGARRADAAGEVAAAAAALDEAVVRLLILERKVDAAQDLLAASTEEAARLEREAEDARERAARASADLTSARERFGERLAASYKAGDLGWLELLLSSGSLVDLVDRSTLLSRVLEQDAALARSVEEARADALRASDRLAEASAGLRERAVEARARRDELDAARAEQAGLVRRLGDRLEEARAAARAAEQRIAAVNDGADGAPDGDAATRPTPEADPAATGATTTTRTTAATTPRSSPAGGDGPPPGGRTLTVKAYAYALRGTTASGIPVAPGVIAVDPRVIPLGTRLWVPGYGEGIAADTGGDIKGNTIDVWMPSEQRARDWGVKTLTIIVYD